MARLPIKIKKLNEKAVLPQKADNGSAGWDLIATSERLVLEGPISYVEYGTSLALEIPPGFVGLLFPRSSISSNTSLILNNSIGLLDSSYRGEIKARFKSTLTVGGKKYKLGDKIAQLMVIPYPEIDFEEVNELSETKRGDGGFGSSDR